MEIVPAAYFDNIKRCWRRRRYQKLDDPARGKKKMKMGRLGTRTRPRLWRIKLVRKLRFPLVSPAKLVAKFHKAYVDCLLRLVGAKDSGSTIYGGKRVPKGQPVPVVCGGDEIVDGRMVMEIYKRLVSTREFAALLV